MPSQTNGKNNDIELCFNRLHIVIVTRFDVIRVTLGTVELFDCSNDNRECINKKNIDVIEFD